jgi:hypothetical protein
MTKIFNVHSLLTIVANKRMLPIFFDNIHLIHDHCNKYSGIMLAVLVQLTMRGHGVGMRGILTS